MSSNEQPNDASARLDRPDKLDRPDERSDIGGSDDQFEDPGPANNRATEADRLGPQPDDAALAGRADRREHGGIPPRMDPDELELRTARERVKAGVQDYVPQDVPPATDAPTPFDVTATEEYQQELAVIRREQRTGQTGIPGTETE